MRGRRGVWVGVVLLAVGPGLFEGRFEAQTARKDCNQAVFEGDVKAGEGFEKVFAKGLKFYLEPLASGWIVRVLADGAPRGPHDFAELATPPYKSVSPLLISTDWSFRAQDAVAWNPRRFKYAKDKATFARLSGLYGPVLRGDAASSATVAGLVYGQPDGVLEILETRLVPGLADQTQLAATVASHLETTPYTVDQSAVPSQLGKIEELRFRVRMDLEPGAEISQTVEKAVNYQKIVCSIRQPAGQLAHPKH